MQHVQITLTAQEAATIIAALGFIRSNLVFSADDGLWRFVSGAPLQYGIGEVVALEDLKARMFDAYSEALEQHAFAPFIKTF